jgi:hypothetical protein
MEGLGRIAVCYAGAACSFTPSALATPSACFRPRAAHQAFEWSPHTAVIQFTDITRCVMPWLQDVSHQHHLPRGVALHALEGAGLVQHRSQHPGRRVPAASTSPASID